MASATPGLLPMSPVPGAVGAVDTVLAPDLGSARAHALSAEEAGFDAVWTTEIAHDPFLPLLLAADATQRLQLGTGIAVAFARSPMTVANAAWDLNAFSGGRFLLGLGSQVKPHVEKRYSMPWGRPAARMREFVQALRAIWDCWQHGTDLRFRGEFYTHTIMTPFFDPGPTQAGAPRVLVAAVGPVMTQVAGEVADGMLAHSFTTERYLREVTLPAIAPGLAARGARREDFQLSLPAMVATASTREGRERAETATRKQIAFYGSTPAYRAILELHGWGALGAELNLLSRRGEWDAMGERITDEVLHAFAVVGEPDEVPGLLRGRFDGVVDRLQLAFADDPEPDLEAHLLAGLRAQA